MDTDEALSEAPPDVTILLGHEAMLMNGDDGDPAVGRMRTRKDDAWVPARQEDDRSNGDPDESAGRESLGAAERLVDAALAINSRHRDKKYAAPVSELPDTPIVIIRAISELHRREGSATRRGQLEGLYIGLSRYGPDDDVRFMGDYFERRKYGARIDDVSWARGRDLMRRTAEAKDKARADVGRLRERWAPEHAAPQDGWSEVAAVILMIAIVYAVYAGIAALIAGITMIVLGPSGLELIAILAVGLASPIVGTLTLVVLGLVSERLPHGVSDDLVAFMIYLTVPVIQTVLALNVSSLAAPPR